MRPRTGALLIVAAGVVCLALSASAQQQRILARRAAGVLGQTASGQSTPMPIAWAIASRTAKSPINTRGQSVNAKFLIANKAAIDVVSIPVLLPGEPDLAAGLRFFPNGAFYAVSSSYNGMSFVLTGAGRAFPLSPATARNLPTGDLSSRIPADGIVIEQAEAGIDAGFTRYGAAYSINLECAQKTADPRCANAAYIRGVISRLMVVVPGSAP